MTERKQGWGYITNSKKWHYYVGGYSLCRKFMKLSDSDLEDDNHGSLDNCATCRRKVEAALASRPTQQEG